MKVTDILGKVELLRFAYEIMKPNMKPDYYQFLLTDTDSVYLAIGSDSLAGCLKPGREKEWKKIEYDSFVDQSTEARTLETKRTPLYWHVEKESLGTMIALASKLYILTDGEGKTVKKGIRGIRQVTNEQFITEKVFEEVLYDKSTLPNILNTGFIQKKEEILTYDLLKHSLHACYPKRGVYDCGIHTFTYNNV